jgi:DNA primase
MNITDVLNQQGISYEKTNNPAEIQISCTSGLHIDTHPSMMYNIEHDIFNCWSCGFRGSKRRFLKSIGINVDIPFDSKQPFKLAKLKAKINELIFENNLAIPEDARKVKGTFKNVSSQTLQYFDAFTTENYGLLDYICIPVYQFGKLRFFEGKNKFKDSNKSKYSRKPSASVTSDILFPIDKIKDKSKLILVEGMFDMLNMWDKGYDNTVCIFGVNNFSTPKLQTLDKIGTVFVEILFDGDNAGIAGARRISQLLDKHDIQSRIIELPMGRDPGDLTHQELNKLLPKERFK